MTGAITAYLRSTSPEDDAAFVALHDLAVILAGHDGTAVIGGHMVGLLTAAFPSEGLIVRRTNDADGGVPTLLAAEGTVQEELEAGGYVREAANRFVKPGHNPKPTIDLLVPAQTAQFRPVWLGERQIDSMPGLRFALLSLLDVDVAATLREGAVLSFTVKVPTVEAAVILKAYAYSNRGAQTVKDLIDLSNLLHVLKQHGADAVGGWQLGAASLIGSRLDAARILTALAVKLETGRVRNQALNERELAFLIRRHVTATN
jgi:hypothetical protein